MQKKRQGFTLIEIVIAIIIIAILAAVALPKFINFESDARAAMIHELKGEMQGAIDLTYSKAVILGVEKVSVYEKDGVAYGFGYPLYDRWYDYLEISYAAYVLTEEWAGGSGNIDGEVAEYITLSELVSDFDSPSSVKDTQCYVKYISAKSPDVRYQLSTVTTGC